MADREPVSLLKFWTPRYWLTWVFIGYMRASVLLPLRWQIFAGRRVGRLLGLLARTKRRIADKNLAVCFPELSAAERKTLRKKSFESLGAGLPEMAMGWFGSEQVVKNAISIEGTHHLAAALEKGKGVLLYCGHLTTIEILHPAIKPLCTRLTGMYRPMRNRLMDEVMLRGRLRSVDEVFSKYTVRSLLKSLAGNSVVYYLADQCYTGKGSALVPFFGVPAMTTTATTRILKASGATILSCFSRRLDDDSSYVVHIEAIPDIPSDDPVRDTALLMKTLEDYVRTCPDQYAWLHRRFKGRPEPYEDIYASI